MVDELPDVAPVADDSKGWAAAAQLLPLLGLSFVAPLIIWLIKRESDPYVEYYGREALNFQISLLIYVIVSALLIFILIGLVLLPVVFIWGVVMEIMGGVKAASGTVWRYPLTIRFVSQ